MLSDFEKLLWKLMMFASVENMSHDVIYMRTWSTNSESINIVVVEKSISL